jgi:hypothetical protein
VSNVGVGISIETPSRAGTLAFAACICTLSAAVACACDCSAPPINEAKTLADVVFRGTIIALRPSNNPIDIAYGHDTQKVAVFRVVHVWKGGLGPNFEMPAIEETSACWGFSPNLLTVGNDLVVYAKRMPGQADGELMFLTSICSRTWFAEGNKDLNELGSGYVPRIPAQLTGSLQYLVRVAGVAAMASLLLYTLRRKRTGSSNRSLS